MDTTFTEDSVYEPPVLVEVGDFAELTMGPGGENLRWLALQSLSF
ncbi:lasso RiPP family leader peptide-containing protein [Streptacidiphilus sp. 4-A2]|nr:lasso RiPP family leader peptide-containing protein [Streptacidiphilus sp. 4-A2]